MRSPCSTSASGAFETRRLAEEQITLVELAEEFGVSRERVRQIEVRAFEKVQKAVRNRVAMAESPVSSLGISMNPETAPQTLRPEPWMQCR